MAIPHNRWLTVDAETGEARYLLSSAGSAPTPRAVINYTDLRSGRVSRADTRSFFPITVETPTKSNLIQDTKTGELYWADLTSVTAGSVSPESYYFMPTDDSISDEEVGSINHPMPYSQWQNTFGLAEYNIYPINVTTPDDRIVLSLGTPFRLIVKQQDKRGTFIQREYPSWLEWGSVDGTGDPIAKVYGHAHKLFAYDGKIFADEPYENQAWNPIINSMTNNQLGGDFKGRQISPYLAPRWAAAQDVSGSIISWFNTNGGRLSTDRSRIALLNELYYGHNNIPLVPPTWGNTPQSTSGRNVVQQNDDLNTKHVYTVYLNIIGQYLIRMFLIDPEKNGYFIDVWDLKGEIPDESTYAIPWVTETVSGQTISFYNWNRTFSKTRVPGFNKAGGVADPVDNARLTILPPRSTDWALVGSVPVDTLARSPYYGFRNPPSIGINHTAFRAGDPNSLELVLEWPDFITSWRPGNRGSYSPSESKYADEEPAGSRTLGFGTISKTNSTTNTGASAVVNKAAETIRLTVKRANNVFQAERDGQLGPDGSITRDAEYDGTGLLVHNPPNSFFDPALTHRITYDGILYELINIGQNTVSGNDRVYPTLWRRV